MIKKITKEIITQEEFDLLFASSGFGDVGLTEEEFENFVKGNINYGG